MVNSSVGVLDQNDVSVIVESPHLSHDFRMTK